MKKDIYLKTFLNYILIQTISFLQAHLPRWFLKLLICKKTKLIFCWEILEQQLKKTNFYLDHCRTNNEKTINCKRALYKVRSYGNFMKKILVVAAHPDDETLGCGGTLKKLSSKFNISVCFLTSGIESRNNKKKRLF